MSRPPDASRRAAGPELARIARSAASSRAQSSESSKAALPAPRRLWSLASKPVTVLNKIGPRRAASFGELGIENVLDLLTHYPRRYHDRSRQVPVAELEVGREVLVVAEVRRVRTIRASPGSRARPRVEVDVHDGTGWLKVTFFNQPWRAKQLCPTSHVALFGKITEFRDQRRMANPVVDLVGNRTGRIVPIYPSSDKAGVASWELAEAVSEALQRAGVLEDPLPMPLRERLELMERTKAFHSIHAPATMGEQLAARRRLAFDELLRIELMVIMSKVALESSSKGISHEVSPQRWGPLLERFTNSLPFELTAAQHRAIKEILSDMASPVPMHRLLQGDVGAGKTVVALSALLAAVQGGYQGALMAPTEVLAEQHHTVLRDLVKGLSVPDATRLDGERQLEVAMLSSKTGAAERSRLTAALRQGGIDIVVGTHALLTEDISFAALGAVVVDEQHRFGGEQRSALREKGRLFGGSDPDLLVMTATPIPRTAAMTVFGDLDLTVVDGLPSGRVCVKTVWAADRELEAEAWDRVRAEVALGHRAYVVCPLVEGSERIEARSVMAERDRLVSDELAGLAVGFIHGQMRSREKEAVMAAFRTGEIQVLVATTVIEVGIDVPQATVMVIEDADRFGLAQLHQLRGRVGRAELESWCYLIGERDRCGSDAERRLRAMEQTTDGFTLAELDLEIRGEGTILGSRQKGRSDLNLASLRKDRDLVQLARKVAEEIVASDPHLVDHPGLGEEMRLFIGEDDAEFLFKS